MDNGSTPHMTREYGFDARFEALRGEVAVVQRSAVQRQPCVPGMLGCRSTSTKDELSL